MIFTVILRMWLRIWFTTQYGVFCEAEETRPWFRPQDRSDASQAASLLSTAEPWHLQIRSLHFQLFRKDKTGGPHVEATAT